MPPGKAKLQLGESWVVEGEDDSPDYSPRDDEEDSPPPKNTPRRPTRGSNRSPEPEFVMPPLDPDTLEASWAESTGKSVRFRKGSADRETRRRNSRQPGNSGSPEKRSRPKNPSAKAPSSGSSKPRTESSNFQDFLDVSINHATAMLSWALEVLGGALRVLKTPISYLLAIWLLFGIGVVVRNLAVNSMYASLSPICRIPGMGLLNLPFCPAHRSDPTYGDPPSVEFDQLMMVQSKFEEVLQDSAGNVALPMDMKRGEASIRDLRQIVRYSQLHSKNELVLEFDGFIDTARIVSYDLQKFNSHIGRAVDSVIATTRWTARVLDGIQGRDADRGSINAFINDKLLAPFQPVKFTEGILLDQYIQHTRVVEEELFKLISEAQALLAVLNNLDDRLEVIHGISIRDGMHTAAMKEEVLSTLWAMLGGNRGKLKNMDRQLNLLQQVGIYRKNAMAHVSGTILKLQAIGANLEDLRERVGAPELLRDKASIPLSVHIENIQLGVERLEEGRSNSRKVEDEQVRKTLERGKLEGSLIDA